MRVAASSSPPGCQYATASVDGVALCHLARIWTNCLAMGECLVDGNGRFLELDNTPDAMAKRAAEYAAEEGDE